MIIGLSDTDVNTGLALQEMFVVGLIRLYIRLSCADIIRKAGQVIVVMEESEVIMVISMGSDYDIYIDRHCRFM